MLSQLRDFARKDGSLKNLNVLKKEVIFIFAK